MANSADTSKLGEKRPAARMLLLHSDEQDLSDLAVRFVRPLRLQPSISGRQLPRT